MRQSRRGAPFITGKQVKALAVLSRNRTPLMPELASADEQGLTGVDVTTWTAIFLPKGAPRPIVDKLKDTTQAAMDTPAIKTRMLEIGVTEFAQTAVRRSTSPTMSSKRSRGGKRPSSRAACKSSKCHCAPELAAALRLQARNGFRGDRNAAARARHDPRRQNQGAAVVGRPQP